MTPQSNFMVVAPIQAKREASLRALLDSMNAAPGMANPANEVLPFGQFEQLHFARLVILDDATIGDLEAFGLPSPQLPVYLCLLGDCDGAARDLLAALAQRAGEGLRRLFEHCEGFDARGDLLAWMLANNHPAQANYVNRVGRTVREVREEAALARALAGRVARQPGATPVSAGEQKRALADFIAAEARAGRLSLTPPAATPTCWWIGNLLHAIGVPLVGILALPLILVLLPLVVVLLRRHETRDPEYCPRPDAAAVRTMQRLEDHDLTNSFTALGSVKPGPFRRYLLIVLLVLIDYACRHVFTRGHLARVRSIHFARWVFLDSGRRVLFASNYDGSHESYMDDFINKVAWGLNLVFSNGFGWPRTDWLILRGARREQRFKYYQRRHQLPTQVWYKAYTGLTLSDLERNRRIRLGLEQAHMTEAQALAWLRLL